VQEVAGNHLSVCLETEETQENPCRHGRSQGLPDIQGVPGGKVTVSVILSKKVYMYMCPIPNGFRDRAVSLYSSETVIGKRYCVLFLTPVFIVQVAKLVQFT
jgi:hypothetical protein